MPTLNDLLYGVLLPALVCGVLLAAIWSARASGVDQSHVRRHLTALALGLGFLTGYYRIAGWPVLPSEGRRLAALDWLPWLVIAAMLVSLVQASGAGRRVPAWSWRALLCVLVALLSFLTRLPWLDLATSALILFVVWQSTDALARRVPGPAVPAMSWVVVTATSVAALLSHSAKIAQLAGALAACLGACVVVAFWNPMLSAAGGAMAIVFTVLGACWINSVHYADLPPSAAGLLVLAPFAPWIARPWRMSGPARGKRVLVCAILAALPAAAAVALAHFSAPSYEY